MDWMRSCWAISGFSSILILTIFTAPSAALTAASNCGPRVLQGPHQGAQKSTITGTARLASSTSAAKVARPESFTCGLAPLAPCAGSEVTGRPPGPINAMGDTFGTVAARKMGFQGAKRKPARPGPPPPHARSALEGEVAVATPWRAGVSRAPRQSWEGRRGSRNQLRDPVGQGEGRGVDGRVVIVGLQLGLLVGRRRLLDAGGRAQWLAALGGPGERHKAADIGGHHAEIEAGAGEEALQFLQRLGDLPGLVEGHAGLEGGVAALFQRALHPVIEGFAEQRLAGAHRIRAVRDDQAPVAEGLGVDLAEQLAAELDDAAVNVDQNDLFHVFMLQSLVGDGQV